MRDVLSGLRMAALEEQARAEALSAGARGVRVRITSKTFNDQVYGRSKKPLTGKLYEVTGAFVDRGTAFLWLEGVQCSVSVDDVELVP